MTSVCVCVCVCVCVYVHVCMCVWSSLCSPQSMAGGYRGDSGLDATPSADEDCRPGLGAAPVQNTEGGRVEVYRSKPEYAPPGNLAQVKCRFGTQLSHTYVCVRETDDLEVKQCSDPEKTRNTGTLGRALYVYRLKWFHTLGTCGFSLIVI